MNIICLLPALPFPFCLPITNCLDVLMYKCVANISCCRYTLANIFFCHSDFYFCLSFSLSFFFFSVSPSFCPSFFSSISSFTDYYTITNIWLNKDEILIESVVCLLVHPLIYFKYKYICIFTCKYMIVHLYICINLYVYICAYICIYIIMIFLQYSTGPGNDSN